MIKKMMAKDLVMDLHFKNGLILLALDIPSDFINGEFIAFFGDDNKLWCVPINTIDMYKLYNRESTNE